MAMQHQYDFKLENINNKGNTEVKNGCKKTDL